MAVKSLFNADKYFYRRNIQLSFIISLLIAIMLFNFFPDLKDSKAEYIKIESPLITIDDIPQTIQKKENANSFTARPPLPAILIPDNILNIEILDDIKIETNNNTNNMNELTLSKKEDNEIGININSFVPKQILEVVPGKTGNSYKGIINLSLKIGKDGKVIEHKVLVNTTHSLECLKQVITAAYNSRWEPVTIGGERKEYWIEKTYIFNN